MSFRLFIYYCALIGGWAALAGWILGRILSPENKLGEAGIRGLGLGLMVAVGLGLVDSFWNLSWRQAGQIALRVGVGLLVGAVGGLVGGIIGQALHTVSSIFFVFGWTLTGLLVGASIGSYEILHSLVAQQNLSGSKKKLLKCLMGGTIGGVLGGLLALMLRGPLRETLFPHKEEGWLWTPTALGFVALGMCIGLLVGLAQVILKEAWIKVEAGFRPGRELILAKEKTTIGRAEGVDIALFGDAGVEKLHALIVLNGDRYFLETGPTPGGTFVNDQKVAGSAALNSGDTIRLGKSLLRFFEKQKR